MAWGSINVPGSGSTTQSSAGTPPATGAAVGDTWYNSESKILLHMYSSGTMKETQLGYRLVRETLLT